MQQTGLKHVAIGEITVGERMRKDLGDLSGLKHSISQTGIVCPIAVTPEMELIYGERRLRAAEQLEMEFVPVVVLESPADHDSYRDMELAENTHRKPFTISERIRIVDQMEPKLTAIKDKVRVARLKGDVAAVDSLQTELGLLLGRKVDDVPKLRSIIAELSELGERAAAKAREIVHALDKTKSTELQTIVAEMDRTGDVHKAFEEYLGTLPAAFTTKATPFYENEASAASESFYENEVGSEPKGPSAGKQFEDVLEDAAAPPKQTSPKSPASKTAKKAGKDAAGESEQKAETPAKPPKNAGTRKARGEDRKVKPEGERLEPEKLRSMYSSWVTATLKKIHPDDQERAAEILGGGMQPAHVHVDEIYDAATAVERIATIIDGIEPDFREDLLKEVGQIIIDHGATIDTQLKENDSDALQQVMSQLEGGIKQLRKRESWSGCADDVRQFVRKARRLVLQFEKHAAVGSAPDRSLFEGDQALPEHLDNEEFRSVFAEWWDDRRKRKMSVTDSVRKKQLKLLGLGDSDQACAIVLKGLENQWKGIPDDIWSDLWDGREPAHAPDAVLQKIRASRPKGGAYKKGEDGRRSASNDRSTFRDDE